MIINNLLTIEHLLDEALNIYIDSWMIYNRPGKGIRISTAKLYKYYTLGDHYIIGMSEEELLACLSKLSNNSSAS